MKKRKSNLIWLYVSIILITIPPFYFWSWRIVISIAGYVGFFMYGLWKKQNNTIRLISTLFFFIFCFYASVHQYIEFNLTGVLWQCILGTIVATVFLIDELNWVIIYKRLVLIYSVFLIPSLLTYFLVRWVGISLPYILIQPWNEMKDYLYQAFPFMVIPDMGNFATFRFCGYFDEPGIVGTISGVLLAVNRCNLRDWKNWPLLVSGIFSYSLFFYIFITIYVLFFGKTKYKILWSVVIVLISVYLVTDNSLFSDLIIERLKFGDDRIIVGDNRTTGYFQDWYANFLKSDKLWFGYGKNYAVSVVDTGGASYTHLIVDYGIIMFLFYFFTFVLYYYSYRLKLKNFLFVLMIFVAIIYQRPSIFNHMFLFLFLSPPAIIKYYEQSSSKEKNVIVSNRFNSSPK